MSRCCCSRIGPFHRVPPVRVRSHQPQISGTCTGRAGERAVHRLHCVPRFRRGWNQLATTPEKARVFAADRPGRSRPLRGVFRNRLRSVPPRRVSVGPDSQRDPGLYGSRGELDFAAINCVHATQSRNLTCNFLAQSNSRRAIGKSVLRRVC